MPFPSVGLGGPSTPPLSLEPCQPPGSKARPAGGRARDMWPGHSIPPARQPVNRRTREGGQPGPAGLQPPHQLVRTGQAGIDPHLDCQTGHGVASPGSPGQGHGRRRGSSGEHRAGRGLLPQLIENAARIPARPPPLAGSAGKTRKMEPLQSHFLSLQVSQEIAIIPSHCRD